MSEGGRGGDGLVGCASLVNRLTTEKRGRGGGEGGGGTTHRANGLGERGDGFTTRVREWFSKIFFRWRMSVPLGGGGWRI